MRLLHAAFAALILFASPAFAGPPADLKALHDQVLAPEVRIVTENGRGSGTIIFSGKDKKGETRTLVLTANHVVDGAKTVAVEFPAYNESSFVVGNDSRDARVVGVSSLRDLAIVEVVDEERTWPVARLAGPDTVVYQGEPVWIVGMPLAREVAVTIGVAGVTIQRPDSPKQIETSAAAIFGNSGGALYRKTDAGDFELIGVPNQIAAIGGLLPMPIAHMSYSVHIEDVRAFLKAQSLDFVLDTNPPAQKPTGAGHQ